jgi:hypothetical protein
MADKNFLDEDQVDKIRSSSNTQGRNNSKRPFMTLQAKPKNQINSS